MKKLFGLLIIVFVLSFCSNVLAVNLAGKFGLSGKGGVGIPMGDFADGANTGFDFGMTGEYFINNQVSLGGYFDYNRFGLKDVADEDVDFTVGLINFGGFAKYIVPTNSNLMPYFKASAGLYQPRFSAESGDFSGSATFDMKFGFAVGGGVMFKASDNVLIGAEAMFNDAMVKDAEANLEDETMKILYDMQYIQINAGITLLVGGK